MAEDSENSRELIEHPRFGEKIAVHGGQMGFMNSHEGYLTFYELDGCFVKAVFKTIRGIEEQVKLSVGEAKRLIMPIVPEI